LTYANGEVNCSFLVRNKPASVGLENEKYCEGLVLAEHQNGRIVESATEARQAEPGPSIFYLLVVSIFLAVVALGAVWLIFLDLSGQRRSLRARLQKAFVPLNRARIPQTN
jgi:hypothetical protein